MSDPHIEITRTFDTSASALFQAWTDPELLEIWLAERATVDLRVGGQYRLESDGDDEMPGLHLCSGLYQAIEPNRRIVKTWSYEGPMAAEPLQTLVTVEFHDLGPEEVEMTFREEGPMLVDSDENALAIEAWTSAFDGLEDNLLAEDDEA